MSIISLEEFKKMGHKEQCIRYKDLSNYDKYIFRVTDPSPFLYAGTIGYMEVTKEQKKESKKRLKWAKRIVNKRLKEIRTNVLEK